MTEDGANSTNVGPLSVPVAEGVSSDAYNASASAVAELPATLISAGYHLRFLNAWRRQFGGRAELAVVPLILWLSARHSSADPQVARAAADALQSIGLTRPASRGYSLRELESITGFRRETLRRIEQVLETQGWVLRDADGAHTESARLSAWLESPAKHERLRDFRWTAERIRELLVRPAGEIGVPIAEALAAMRACRTDELPATFGRSTVELPRHFLPVARVHMHGYNLRHLLQVAPHFAGDIDQAILLGEIGHRNTAALTRDSVPENAEAPMGLHVSVPGESAEVNRRRASNAYSLALALDIPYETIRRKLTTLCRAGRLTRDGQGLYWVRPGVAEEFNAFNGARRADMLATAAAIDALAGSGHPSPPVRRPA